MAIALQNPSCNNLRRQHLYCERHPDLIRCAPYYCSSQTLQGCHKVSCLSNARNVQERSCCTYFDNSCLKIHHVPASNCYDFKIPHVSLRYCNADQGDPKWKTCKLQSPQNLENVDYCYQFPVGNQKKNVFKGWKAKYHQRERKTFFECEEELQSLDSQNVNVHCSNQFSVGQPCDLIVQVSENVLKNRSSEVCSELKSSGTQNLKENGVINMPIMARALPAMSLNIEKCKKNIPINKICPKTTTPKEGDQGKKYPCLTKKISTDSKIKKCMPVTKATCNYNKSKEPEKSPVSRFVNKCQPEQKIQNKKPVVTAFGSTCRDKDPPRLSMRERTIRNPCFKQSGIYPRMPCNKDICINKDPNPVCRKIANCLSMNGFQSRYDQNITSSPFLKCTRQQQPSCNSHYLSRVPVPINPMTCTFKGFSPFENRCPVSQTYMGYLSCK